MKQKAFVGIDPGASGCIAAILENGSILITRMTTASQKDQWEALKHLTEGYECFCVLEAVHSFPGQGVSSTFTFGKNAGFIEGLLVAAEIPFEAKTPQTWQKHFSMKKDKAENISDYKRRLRQKAEQLYPNLKFTNDIADAVLIAEYCRRLKGGEIVRQLAF